MWRLNLVWGQRTKDAGVFLEKRLWRHEAGASRDPHPRPSRTRVLEGLAPGLGPKAEGGHGVCEPGEAEGTVDPLPGPWVRARGLGMFGRPQLTGDTAWKDGRVAASPASLACARFPRPPAPCPPWHRPSAARSPSLSLRSHLGLSPPSSAPTCTPHGPSRPCSPHSSHRQAQGDAGQAVRLPAVRLTHDRCWRCAGQPPSASALGCCSSQCGAPGHRNPGPACWAHPKGEQVLTLHLTIAF